MRWLVALLLLTPAAAAHTYSEHGNVTGMNPDSDEPNLISLLLNLAPGVLPQGVLHYRVANVRGGDAFTVVADDGQEPFFWCDLDCCKGDTNPPEGYDNGTPLEGTAADSRVDRARWTAERSPEELFDLATCNHHPDFDVLFSAGSYRNGAGDEAGMVPGDGDAVVVLFFGDLGEGFTYSESEQ